MKPKWTGELIAKMHVNEVSATELAQYMGVSKQYISYLLNNKRKTKNAEIVLNLAVDQLIQQKRGDSSAKSRLD